MTANSFAFSPLVFAYAVGVGISLVVLIQMIRVKFKRRYHEIFIIAAATATLWLVTRVLGVMAEDPQTFLMVAIPQLTLAIFLNALAFHFILQFVSPRLTSIQKLAIVGAYAVAFIFALGAILNVGILAILYVVKWASGFVIAISLQGYLIQSLYFFILALTDLGYLLRYYFAHESPLLRLQTRYLMGSWLVAALALVSVTISSFLSIPPLDWLLYPASLGVMLIGFRKHGFLTVNPTAEEQSNSPAKYDLAPGLSYLFLEEEAKRPFEVFDDLIEHGHLGLCVTRYFPENVRENYGIEKAPIRWLSESRRKDAIPPSDLLGLSFTLQRFLENVDKPVVLLHGLEYLTSINGFKPILRLVQQIGEVSAQKHGIILIPLVPGSLTDRQYALLAAECKPLRQDEIGLAGWLRGKRS